MKKGLLLGNGINNRIGIKELYDLHLFDVDFLYREWKD